MYDSYDYPNEKMLNKIKKYSVPLFNVGDVNVKDGSMPDIQKIIDCMYKTWWMPHWGIVRNDNILELHTGGWSGNEEIISVLKDSLFWQLYWFKTIRGGHYYFKF